MQLLSAFITALALSTGVLAQGWHGCAPGYGCHSNEECRQQRDCQQLANGNLDKIYCGQANHPIACWAYTS
ncbi:hypothetical protein BDV32DRAFT_144887 [Aspergillus pseudonomiae]|uniref:Uncharacterized protein n=1 Tax=Aspergillus pseudonomiae TaxID=1506151 RepID=A0A5N6IDN5_9EURO|nr:uncharacterized protein BDV37DRAFT_280025 [Aspergillus pseudonomiae]KAB8264852.1 hypothetical protein BDV32DRAFT_144887 [Aspergillus pseudonomiae]KAE8407491.1 hypothetical protein BDV37DRAFT_280025 [Aspergillus pseudonomiae]